MHVHPLLSLPLEIIKMKMVTRHVGIVRVVSMCNLVNGSRREVISKEENRGQQEDRSLMQWSSSSLPLPPPSSSSTHRCRWVPAEFRRRRCEREGGRCGCLAGEYYYTVLIICFSYPIVSTRPTSFTFQDQYIPPETYIGSFDLYRY